MGSGVRRIYTVHTTTLKVERLFSIDPQLNSPKQYIERNNGNEDSHDKTLYTTSQIILNSRHNITKQKNIR